VRDANLFLLLSACVVIYACYALRALRWQVFQRNLGPSHFWNIYKLTWRAFPRVLARRAGEPVRPLLLARKEKLAHRGHVRNLRVERLFDTASAASLLPSVLFLYEVACARRPKRGVLETAAKTTGSVLLRASSWPSHTRVSEVHGTAMLERRLPSGFRGTLLKQNLPECLGVCARRANIAPGANWPWQFYTQRPLVSGSIVYFWGSPQFCGKLASITLSDAMLVMALRWSAPPCKSPESAGLASGLHIAYTAIFGVEREPAVAAAIVLGDFVRHLRCSCVPLLIHEGWSLDNCEKSPSTRTKS